jgi:hypothetical protein
MKSLAAFIFSALLLVIPAAAQRGGSHSGGGHHSGGSGFHGGYTGSVGGGGGYGGGYYRGRALAVPFVTPSVGYGYYGYPAYSYGYGDPGYGYAAPPPPDAAGYPPPDQAVLPPPDDNAGPIPQPDDSQLRIYQAPTPTLTPEEQAMNEGRYYLIAYKDHSVYTALAYWMENGALNYVTPQSAHNQVSLDLLDLDMTKQLNARRGLPFNLVNR